MKEYYMNCEIFLINMFRDLILFIVIFMDRVFFLDRWDDVLKFLKKMCKD